MKTFQKFKSTGSANAVSDSDIDIIQKSINNILPSLKLSRLDTEAAIFGNSVPRMEKYLDIDVLELSKSEGIPAIFFHLVIGEFSGTKLSQKASKKLRQAKELLNELDGNIYASEKEDSSIVRMQLDKFCAGLKQFFDAGKFVPKLSGVQYIPYSGKIIIPKAIQLSELEREYGMARNIENGKLFWTKNRNEYNSISSSEKPLKIKNTKTLLFGAADRAFGKSTEYESVSSDWKNLAKSEKEKRIHLRLSRFFSAVKKMFPNRKFSAQGTKLSCDLPDIALNSKALSKLEKEFGMIRSIIGRKITWLLVPSTKYFTSHSSYGKLSPLISLILKLDPKAIITKIGKILRVVSPRLTSSRLDDAFETVGKKCGAFWKGRTGQNKEELNWQTLHSLN